MGANLPYMGKCGQCDEPATSFHINGAAKILYCHKHSPFKIAPDPRIAELEAENAALTRRLAAMMPLFQEARDALTAIPLVLAKMRGLDLTLGDRMDDVGVKERWEAFNEELNKPEFLPCGHHSSLMLKSAETGEPLYCELCDAISRRNDAEKMESEARAEAAALRADAERWRWWRAMWCSDSDITDDFFGTDNEQDMDVEVDAARRAGE